MNMDAWMTQGSKLEVMGQDISTQEEYMNQHWRFRRVATLILGLVFYGALGKDVIPQENCKESSFFLEKASTRSGKVTQYVL